MVEHCSDVTPRPTQQRASKPRRGHCIELMDITSLLIKIYSENLNIHQKMNSRHVIQINNYS